MAGYTFKNWRASGSHSHVAEALDFAELPELLAELELDLLELDEDSPELEEDLLELEEDELLEFEDTAPDDEEDLLGASFAPEHCVSPTNRRIITTTAAAMMAITNFGRPPPEGAGGSGGVGGAPSSETVPTTTPQLWQNFAPSGSLAPQLLQNIAPPSIGQRAHSIRNSPYNTNRISNCDERTDMTVRLGILGYGNLGKGVELAVRQNDDIELAAVYTRRDPRNLTIATEGVAVKSASALEAGDEPIDVLILCGGSATDLPEQTPHYAKLYNVVDSFDTHAKIPEHFAAVDAAAAEGGNAALISCGWDPGLFSLNRLMGNCILPDGADYTFWGRGISQGHSDAIRRIEGVADAKQYTIPIESALDAVRSGENPELTTRQKHLRECWVVLEEGADPSDIEQQIKTMPNYFDEYDVTVNFISQEELDRDHNAMPHGGFVLRSGMSAGGNKMLIEYSLKLDSNPEFTSCVLVAYARAIARLASEGKTGAFTVFDIAPAYLSPLDGATLRAKML